MRAEPIVDDPGELLARIEDALDGALAFGGRPVARLATARTSVTFEVVGVNRPGVALLLDRDPPVVCDGPEPTEITVVLHPEQVGRFLAGTLELPNEMLLGNVTWQGPVRRYLTIDPVLRALLKRVAGGL